MYTLFKTTELFTSTNGVIKNLLSITVEHTYHLKQPALNNGWPQHPPHPLHFILNYPMCITDCLSQVIPNNPMYSTIRFFLRTTKAQRRGSIMLIWKHRRTWTKPMMVKMKVPMRSVRIIRVLVALSRDLSRTLISCTQKSSTQGHP